MCLKVGKFYLSTFFCKISSMTPEQKIILPKSVSIPKGFIKYNPENSEHPIQYLMTISVGRKVRQMQIGPNHKIITPFEHKILLLFEKKKREEGPLSKLSSLEILTRTTEMGSRAKNIYDRIDHLRSKIEQLDLEHRKNPILNSGPKNNRGWVLFGEIKLWG